MRSKLVKIKRSILVNFILTLSLERLEKSRKQSKDGKGKDADTAIKEIRKKYNL